MYFFPLLMSFLWTWCIGMTQSLRKTSPECWSKCCMDFFDLAFFHILPRLYQEDVLWFVYVKTVFPLRRQSSSLLSFYPPKKFKSQEGKKRKIPLMRCWTQFWGYRTESWASPLVDMTSRWICSRHTRCIFRLSNVLVCFLYWSIYTLGRKKV